MIAGTIYADVSMINHGIVAHGVNCQGKMGAGVAKDLAAKFPGMLDIYAKFCGKGQFSPGQIWAYHSGHWNPTSGGGVVVINMATQEFYGHQGRAKLEWIRECVTKMEGLPFLVGNQAPIYIPEIGCGHGGLKWEDVSKIFESSRLTFIVCKILRCIIAGSRDMCRQDLLYDATDSCPWRNEITSVVSGRATGADTLGSVWGLLHNKKEIPFFPDWSKGKSAGHARNLIMAKNADALIVIRKPSSRGSANMVEVAHQMGLLVHDVLHDEHVDFGAKSDVLYQEDVAMLRRSDAARGISNPYK